MSRRVIRIGGGSAGWGDSVVGADQLADAPGLDYIAFDFLAETTMAILAKARARDPAKGWVPDFVDHVMATILDRVARRGLRIVTNAGGLNPHGCADALRRLADERGVRLRIAVVDGDDVSGLLARSPEAFARFHDDEIQDRGEVLTANAYLGAFPIARALDGGAQVVVTGRCADSALALGPLIHEFAWQAADFDLLAAGSLVGHLIECGAQGSGGLHTDWRRIGDWSNIGYPIAECSADGTFVMTKPPGTDGLVEPAVVAEQLLYEIGDPAAYLLPDVSCDFTAVSLVQEGKDRVRVAGVRGNPPPPTLKVTLTGERGFRSVASLVLVGEGAVDKARRTADAIISRVRRALARSDLGDFTAVHVELLGAEQAFGASSRAGCSREVVMRLVVDHENPAALRLFGREIAAPAVSWMPGTTGIGARPTASPVIWLRSASIAKSRIEPQVSIDGDRITVPFALGLDGVAGADEAPHAAPAPEGSAPVTAGQLIGTVPLSALAWLRSGDKGDIANVGVIARSEALWPHLLREVTPCRVRDWFAHFVDGDVTRFLAPGFLGMNFVMTKALAGGGPTSPRIDPLAKAFAQILAEMPVEAPLDLIQSVESRHEGADGTAASSSMGVVE